jgi:hypothetical protein
MIGKCKLCGRNTTLILSHIIPRFAVKWLKRTSLTGFFRSVTSATRLQETKRDYLLCSDCEQLLGKDERRFKEWMFSPYHYLKQQTFTYEDWLLRFVVGLHWRVIPST